MLEASQILFNGNTVSKNIRIIIDPLSRVVRSTSTVVMLDKKECDIDFSIELQHVKLGLGSILITFRGYENIHKFPFEFTLIFHILKRTWDVKGKIGGNSITHLGIASCIDAQKVILESIVESVKNQL